MFLAGQDFQEKKRQDCLVVEYPEPACEIGQALDLYDQFVAGNLPTPRHWVKYFLPFGLTVAVSFQLRQASWRERTKAFPYLNSPG